MPFDPEFLRTLVLQLMATGAAGLAVTQVIDRVPQLSEIEDLLAKRLVALALSVLFAGALYGLGVAMLYVPAPETARAAIEAVAALGALAFTASQAAHGAQRRGADPRS